MGTNAADRESHESRRAMFVAAAMMISVGLGAFAYYRAAGREAPPPTVGDRTASIPSAFERLALACPSTLRSAVDDPLLGELEDIAEDATRTVRFLAGRVPTTLVARGTEDSGR